MKTRAAWAAATATLLMSVVVWAQSVAVYRKYKGQIVISDTDIKQSEDDKEMLAELKRAKKEVLEKPKGEQTWPFYFIAFLNKKPGAADVSLFFYDSKTHQMSFYRDLQVDPNTTIVAFDLEFSEDDGVTPGKKYDVSLGRMVGTKETSLAKAKVTFK